MDKQALAVFAVFTLSAWIAWLIFNAVRQVTLAKTKIALQDRLLLRISSPETLRVFLDSPLGADYLRELQRDPLHPWQRTIDGFQAAVVFGIIGVGALLGNLMWPRTGVILPFAMAALVIAFAVAASTGLAFRLYRRSDLLSARR